jgi:23S rRNA-/tRNA-specific pseudouridylate synthase
MQSLDKWAQFCLPKRIKILKSYYNDSILALEKPIGYLSHPNVGKGIGNDDKVIIRGDYDFKKEYFLTKLDGNNDSQQFKSYLVHRLDKATSGVILVTRDEEIAKSIKEAFRKKIVNKEYIALVFGHFPTKETTWTDSFSRQTKNTFNRVNAGLNFTEADAPLSQTKVSLITHMNQFNTSLVKLSPLTGHMNQLRYQCSIRGFPIVGDRVYGDFDLNKYVKASRLYLHAASISLQLELKGEKVDLDVTSDLPDEFYQFDTSVKKVKTSTDEKKR